MFTKKELEIIRQALGYCNHRLTQHHNSGIKGWINPQKNTALRNKVEGLLDNKIQHKYYDKPPLDKIELLKSAGMGVVIKKINELINKINALIENCDFCPLKDAID